MLTPAQIEASLDRILMKVQKPGRYFGGELNQIIKPWDSVRTHVALIFPEVYDLGLPNLGIQVLYEQVNNRADALAERAYVPWIDMEAEMRATQIPLYTLESKHPLADFDILGFTLPYESLYTNVLTALDLAGLPLLAAERTNAHPLVIAGGHAAFNPEPMSSFFDAFAIGEGEEVIHDIINAYQLWQASLQPRDALWPILAAIPGVYVPRLYDVTYNPDGTLAEVKTNHPAAHLPVVKRVVAILPPPPTKLLVPSIDIVHNRISIEIMRGCTRGCRFCQAGMITRPVRERSIADILAAMEAALDATGYEEVGLLSLSSSDYTHVKELVEAVSQRFSHRKLSVSLPSLRIDSFSVQLMDGLKELRPGGGFTLAPEAATEHMRQVINKGITSEQLMETVQAVFDHGWTTVKLYFMIGHPDETIEDVEAIVDLCWKVLQEGRRRCGGRTKVNVGVSTFIPKPHTPFQWVTCDDMEQIRIKQNLLRRGLKNPGFKVSWVDPDVTLHEAWLSRGDRRMGPVILRAWQLGSKFDAWQESYNVNNWRQAFADCGLDPNFYSHRTRELDEILPWGHISTAVRASFLKEEYKNSHEGIMRADCREECFACGILPGFNELRMTTPPEAWKCPPVLPRSKHQPAEVS